MIFCCFAWIRNEQKISFFRFQMKRILIRLVVKQNIKYYKLLTFFGIFFKSLKNSKDPDLET